MKRAGGEAAARGDWRRGPRLGGRPPQTGRRTGASGYLPAPSGWGFLDWRVGLPAGAALGRRWIGLWRPQRGPRLAGRALRRARATCVRESLRWVCRAAPVPGFPKEECLGEAQVKGRASWYGVVACCSVSWPRGEECVYALDPRSSGPKVTVRQARIPRCIGAWAGRRRRLGETRAQVNTLGTVRLAPGV